MVLDDGKEGARAQITVDESHVQSEVVNGAVAEKAGTAYDRRDMVRMVVSPSPNTGLANLC